MPAALADKSDRSEQMWNALKAHILRERERKKQEREAEVEEERLRKEREAREQQNVMTLGETREQISQLEAKLTQLKDEKHQLFLQLKKVLNEDDNRRRQLVKESNDIITIQALPSSLVNQQLYLPPSAVPRSTPMPQQSFKTTPKRPRSPSPQPAVPVSLYHQGYGYKPPTVVNASYQTSPQKMSLLNNFPKSSLPMPIAREFRHISDKEDDNRRHELVRAVLWNKTAQYANQPGTFYTVPPQELSIYYPQPPIASREPPRGVYDSPRPQSYHLDQAKTSLEHYALRPPTSHSHVIHGGSIPLNPAQPPSTGSITAGYPIRIHKQQTPAAALYTTQSRTMYQSPGTPINYPPRE